MQHTDQYSEIFADSQKILCIFAHPDDAEVYAGGTIARLTSDGKEVRTVKVTKGNKGSRQEQISEVELSALREEEDSNASKALRIKPENNVYLHFSDGSIENNHELIETLVLQIRTFKPDVIMTHNPEDVIIRFDNDINWVNHRDHRNTGKSAIDAAYPYSRDLLFFPEQLKKDGVDSHSTYKFLLVDYYDHEDCVEIDVTEHVDTRNKALASHSSQYSLEDAKASTEFFCKRDETDRMYEKFRFVIAD